MPGAVMGAEDTKMRDPRLSGRSYQTGKDRSIYEWLPCRKQNSRDGQRNYGRTEEEYLPWLGMFVGGGWELG